MLAAPAPRAQEEESRMSETRRDPQTTEEWQDAVDAAQALLEIDSAKQYGLITGGPDADVQRCEEILLYGKAQGIYPRDDCVQRFIAGGG